MTAVCGSTGRCALSTETSARAKAPGRSAGSGFSWMRMSPRRVSGSMIAPSRRTVPVKGRLMPVRYTVAACPLLTTARSCSAIWPRISTSPPLAMRNSGSPPGLAICPTSAWRVSTTPSTGATRWVRARRACASASCAATTLTFAASVTEVARRFSMSSADSAPAASTPWARLYSAAESAAWARACSSEAARRFTCCTSTESSMRASGCPRLTWSPASTNTPVIRPVSPSLAIGMS